MIQAIALAASGLFLLTTFGGSVIAAEQQLSCKGQMVESTGEQTAPIDLTLNLGGPGKTTIEMGGNKNLNVRVTTDNPILLRFKTNQFVGELYLFTGELFLIFKSGKLGKLNCSYS